MSIRVQFFGALRDARGVPEETLTDPAADATELWRQIETRLGRPLSKKGVSVAVNNALGPWTQPVRDGDTVAFLPPICGG